MNKCDHCAKYWFETIVNFRTPTCPICLHKIEEAQKKIKRKEKKSYTPIDIAQKE